jgi:leader peptidase (prepilin peptidase)/N-methyltransferase
VIAAASFWFLLVLAAIDLDCLRLPNPLIGLLALLGVGAAVAGQLTHVLLVPLPALEGDMVASASLLWSLGGAVLGAGLAGGIAAVYGAIRHRKGLGMGDVKLLAAMGLLLGPYVILAIFLGSLIGMLAVLATTGTEWSSGRRIPFGPWLSLGAIITALAGAPLWQWYLQVASLA